MNGIPPQCELRRALKDASFPEEVFQAWEAEGITALLPIQIKAIEAGCLEGRSLLILGPTSCGKTFVGELTAVRNALEMRRALYLVPFKALAEEKHADFRQKYGRREIGAEVIISTADRRDADRRLAEGDFNIGILTYEKLSALLVYNPSILSGLGCVVVDEVQMVSDETRGAELELLLTRIRRIAPQLQILGLSAAVSELNGFDGWLGAQVVRDGSRPVMLREGVILPSGEFTYVEWSDERGKSRGVERLHALRGDDNNARVASLIDQILRDPETQVLVFVSTVANTYELAESIASRANHLPAAGDAKRVIATLEQTESTEQLEVTLNHSIAFHNADLTIDERLAVEAGFRDRTIRCIVSTSTLSMGVNLPASTVVIAEHTKWFRDASGNWTRPPITVAEYRNMSGRAGRFGLARDNFGRAILIAESPIQRRALMGDYVDAEPESLASAFLKQPLDVRVLRVIASGLSPSLTDLRDFLLATFAARRLWQTQAARASMERDIKGIVDDLADKQLITTDNQGALAVALLGRICATSGLRIGSFDMVRRLATEGSASLVDVAFVASRCEDTGPGTVTIRFSTEEYRQRTPYLLQDLRTACQQASSPLTEADLDRYSSGIRPDYDTGRCLKYQLVALAYVSGTATRDIENRLSVPAGRIRAIGSSCSWLSETAAKIARLLGRDEVANSYETLAARFLHGCTEKALLLAQVPYRMHRHEREALVAAGYDALQKIVDVTPVDLAKAARVSRGRVEGLQRAIVELLGDGIELERGQVTRLAAVGIDTAVIEELYAARGVQLEQALEALLRPPFCPLTVSRIARQSEGEADLRIILSDGRNGIAAVTAKDRSTDKVGLTKAGSVLQQSPELDPQVFICIGRPDFDPAASRKAAAHASGGCNYKLIRVSTLAEMFVRFHEKRLSPDRVREVIEMETGDVTVDRL